MSTRKITEKLSPALLKIGIAICLFCIGIFFFIAWLLEYKDTSSGSITITTTAIPLELYAKETGQLKLLIKNNSSISEGDFLGYIKNTTNMEDGLYLLDQINEMSTISTIQQFATFVNALDQKELGSIAPSVVNLSNQIKAYQVFIETDRHQEMVAAKKKQIDLYKNYVALIDKKIELHNSNTVIVEQQLLVDQQLYEEDVLSKRQLENAKRALNKESIEGRLVDFQSTISETNIKIAIQEEHILDLGNAFQKEKMLFKEKIINQFQLLRNSVNNWKEKYLIIADMSGKLIYSDYLSDYLFIKKDSKIMTISPTNNEEYLGILKLPVKGISKVKPGQPVQIRVDNYPFSEFGILEGRVTTIANIPNNNSYIVQVDFPNNLHSTYDIDFKFQQLMTGQADVITSKLSLWQRVYNQMRSIQHN